MKNIIYCPIEPLTERYSESWYRNFPIEFTKAGFNVIVIDGLPLVNDDIKVGTFLDINSTCHYKWVQLQKISEMFHLGQVKNGTIFFFGDIEFWGLEAIRLLADMNRVDIKLTGFLHAGSYTIEDAFQIAEPYQKYTEVGWVAACDKVFVGSNYHKQAFKERRLESLNASYLDSKIIVTKNPIFLNDYKDYPGVRKKKKVLLTNRFDDEKRPGNTLFLFNSLKKEFPEWEFVVTTSRKTFRSNNPYLVKLAKKLEAEGIITIKAALSKDEYHYELAEASLVVSHSIEENYGFCIAEALLYGVLPLLSNVGSHSEFVPKELTFNYHAYRQNCDSFDLYQFSDLYIALNLLKSWGTDNWPKIPTLDISGMNNIIRELSFN